MAGWLHWCNGHELGKLWEMMRDREAWQASVHGVVQNLTWLGDWTTELVQVDILDINLWRTSISDKAVGRIITHVYVDIQLNIIIYIQKYHFSYEQVHLLFSPMLLCCVQLCLTLCDPMGWIPPGSSIHGIFQARTLEWVDISFSSVLLSASNSSGLGQHSLTYAGLFKMCVVNSQVDQ